MMPQPASGNIDVPDRQLITASETVLALLTAAAWLRDGKVNPRVHEVYAERAAHERKTRAERRAKLDRGRETILRIYG